MKEGMKSVWQRVGQAWLDYLMMTVGALIYAASIVVLIQPANIPLGGVSGLALLANYLFELPTGAMILLLNLPLFFISYKIMGRSFFARTVYATAVTSFAVDLLGRLLPVWRGDAMLTLLYGGVGMGIGCGLIFLCGGTAGGFDVLAKVASRRTGASVGTFSLLFSGTVIVLSAFVLRRVESAMYAIIMQFVYSWMINSMLYGLDQSTGAFIITGAPKPLADALMQRLHRGVTALSGTGMYTGQERSVLLCAVRRQEVAALKSITNEIDPTAFIMLTDVNEVCGKGFHHMI